MLGLMYLGFAALYLSLMFIVMRGAWRGGASEGGSRIRGSIYGAIALLLFNGPLFWNYIPVTLGHRSMCNKDGGFRAYVTPEVWVSARHDELAELSEVQRRTMSAGKDLSDGFRRYEYLGGLLTSEWMSTQSRLYGIRVVRIEERMRDTKSNRLMMVVVDYRIGSRDDVRLWFADKGCFGADDPNNPFFESQRYSQKIQELSK